MPRQSAWFIILVFAALSATSAAEDDFSEVVARHRSVLVGRSGKPQLSPPDPLAVRHWIVGQSRDGAWPDIDYTSQIPSAWPAMEHLRRTRLLVLELVRPDPVFADGKEVERAILAAIDHWLAHRYQNPNWWQNRIGVPQVMRDIIVLLGERLQGERRAGTMEVLRQFRLMRPGDGANTLWSAELALMAAALDGDAKGLAEASALIAGEIRMGGKQGIQSDFSFHQHGPRLQQYHYGLSFFEDAVRLAWLLRGTPWDLGDTQVGLLASFAEHGSLWMNRGRATAPSTLDRAVSRPGNLAPASLTTELSLLAELMPERADEFGRWQRQIAAGLPVHEGFRHYPRSDFTVYHTPDYSAFVKTVSTRTALTETLSGENRQGRKLHWGDHYFVATERDYTDLPPVWDWNLLPGVTSSPDLDEIDRRLFVGALGAGDHGVAAMDYGVGRGGTTVLTARKFWAFHAGVTVSLIGALQQTATGQSVRTALDQRRLRGEVTAATAAGMERLPPGRHSFAAPRWIHHGGLLYVPIGGRTLSLELGPKTGSWRTINANHADTPITEPVFLSVLEHGAGTELVAGGFAVLGCPEPTDAESLIRHKAWVVLRNDEKVQAVRFDDGTWMAAFYAADELELEPAFKITPDGPCLLLFGQGVLQAGDPSQIGRVVKVVVERIEHTFDCPPGGGPSNPVSIRSSLPWSR